MTSRAGATSTGIVVGVGETDWREPDVAVLRDAGGRAVEPSIVRAKSPALAASEPAREDVERLARFAPLA